MAPRDPISEVVEVVVVGGGFSGLLTAIALREAGIDDVRILEKGSDFGGTWYWNRYPGLTCDVESYIYMPLLEETGYVPSERYASASEIREYACAIGERWRLYERAIFQTRVTDVAWDEADRRWLVHTNGHEGSRAGAHDGGHRAFRRRGVPG